MPRLSYRKKMKKTSESEAVTIFNLFGFIDATTHGKFRKLLNTIEDLNTHAVLNFHHATYINSSGISGLINLNSALQARGKRLIFSHVPEHLGQTMALLGVTSMVVFSPDDEKAIIAIETGLQPIDKDENAASKSQRMVVRRVHRQRIRLPEQSSVLVVVKKADRFTEILQKRLRRKEGRYTVVTDCSTALDSIAKEKPQLVVVDDTVGRVDEFLRKLKIKLSLSTVSVIRLYSEGSGKEANFRVVENDFLCEPFEMMELFTLCETEIIRRNRKEGLVAQEVLFSFSSLHENVKEAIKLIRNLAAEDGFPEAETTSIVGAVREAVDNAVLHGNRDKPHKRVICSYISKRDAVEIFVQDQGEGFDYEYWLRLAEKSTAKESAAKAKREERRGGLGIRLMYKCADDLSYSENGSIVRILKHKT